ncbi:MAG: toll/interleukin-1 receptor domain-containing protein [Cyclobacteriaceae bacterium]
MLHHHYEYDAFISHAVEDKIPIANELCAKLEKAGLKIWYSGKELGVGDSIEKTIQKGLNRSRFGIVIFSPTYLAKNWTIREFYTLLSKEIEEHKVILPVLYNVTLDDLKNRDLLMADRFAVNADRGMDFVVQKLVQEIQKSQSLKAEPAWFTKLWFILILSLITNVGFLLKGNVFSQSDAQTPQGQPSMNLPVRNKANNVVRHKTFLQEVGGMFGQVGYCQCIQPDNDQASPVSYQTNFNDNSGANVIPFAGYHDSDESNAMLVDAYSNPRKMTMALVFQMETFAESAPEIQRDMNHMIKKVINSENGFFDANNLSKK